LPWNSGKAGIEEREMQDYLNLYTPNPMGSRQLKKKGKLRGKTIKNALKSTSPRFFRGRNFVNLH
jgi:hypothetical protein